MYGDTRPMAVYMLEPDPWQVTEKQASGIRPRGRDCHSRLGAFAMTGPECLSNTGCEAVGAQDDVSYYAVVRILIYVNTN